MAGAVGFEPTVHEIKTRCLTTWLRPNNFRFFTLSISSFKPFEASACVKRSRHQIEATLVLSATAFTHQQSFSCFILSAADFAS